MFQFALSAALFTFKYAAPQFAPLLQLPPTMATAREREKRRTEGAHNIPLY